MKTIHMVDLGSQYMDIKNDVDVAIQKVIDSAKFINGPIVKEFEANLANWNSTKHVIACGNGTDALQISMMALGLKPGDEVIVPAFTYIATAETMVLLGLKPIFVDVEYDSFNLDCEKVKEAITDRTRLIVPVHLYGQCSNMEEINAIAKENNLFVVEDLAQALGSTYNGVKVGNLSDIGVTSFFPSKNLGCYGDGGALLTNDDALAEKIRMIANHGQVKKYYHSIVGVNSRLDSIQAAILNEKLKHLNQYQQSRQEVASYYDKQLQDLDYIQVPSRTANSTHVFHQYTLKVADGKRDALAAHLKENGIPSMIYYPLPIPEQEAYISYKMHDYQVSTRLCEEVLSLPIHTHMPDDHLSYITDVIKKFE